MQTLIVLLITLLLPIAKADVVCSIHFKGNSILNNQKIITLNSYDQLIPGIDKSWQQVINNKGEVSNLSKILSSNNYAEYLSQSPIILIHIAQAHKKIRLSVSEVNLNLNTQLAKSHANVESENSLEFTNHDLNISCFDSLANSNNEVSK